MEWDLHKRYYFINQYKIKQPLFTDEQVIIADSEDNLQRGIVTLQSVAKNCGIEILPVKSEMIAFLGQDPVRCKICWYQMCTTSIFKYVGCETSYENEKGV